MKPRILLCAVVLSFVISLTGCVGNGGSIPIPGVKGPDIILDEDRVRVTMVFTGLPLDVGARYAIPGTKDSYIELSPDFESDGTLFVANMSMVDLSNSDPTQIPSMGLPDGRPLPGVPGGRLPATALSIQNFPFLYMYFSQNYWGMFFPLPFSINQNFTFPYFVSGKQVGNITMVGTNYQGQGSGLLIMLDINKSTKRLFKRRIRKYR